MDIFGLFLLQKILTPLGYKYNLAPFLVVDPIFKLETYDNILSIYIRITTVDPKFIIFESYRKCPNI